FTEEKLGQAEKTELDAHFESLLARADCTKNWTEKIYRQTEVLLQPNPSARIEEFLYEKLDRKVPYRATNGEILGQYMLEAAKEFGSGTPYGSTLIQVGDCQRRLGGAEREFLQTSAISFLTPLRNFLEGDWRTITKERRLLENLRLDLDACKARLKKAKAAEAKAATVPDFHETRPRNYVLSASASAVSALCVCVSQLWTEEVEKVSVISLPVYVTLLLKPTQLPHCSLQHCFPVTFNLACCTIAFVRCCAVTACVHTCIWQAEQELRAAQTEFDRQAEVTRLLLEGISSTHVNHLRCLHEFVEAQATYYGQCHHVMQELQKELRRRYPNSFVVNPRSVRCPSLDPSSTVPVNSLSPEVEALQIEEVHPPASGTRRAKVLYDYDAADTSELSLLADE
ncbi:hypothetical protein P4O66_023043, partial [Electrophorus voltai]